MNALYIVDLSEGERQQLEQLTRGGRPGARRMKRAQVSMKADKGLTDEEIAEALQTSTSTVFRTRRKFVEGGLEHALNEARRPGGRRVLWASDVALPGPRRPPGATVTKVTDARAGGPGRGGWRRARRRAPRQVRVRAAGPTRVGRLTRARLRHMRIHAMHFIDEATIHVKAGDGGNGCAAMRREAHVARGGPAGGDGGDGGDVIAVADAQLSTLLDFKYRRHYKAQRGEDGRGKDQYGKAGEDLVLRVPVGTVVRDADTGEVLADLDRPEARCVLARGGRGGRGNIHFKTPWNQAPRTAEPGTPGQERAVRLELKLLADVGLLGYPSVGKSTLIARISRARPKIADYPFTTLVPNLGVVRLSDDRSFVVADIPGLIEGAADGAGLGHKFLRHVERTRVLVHVLEASLTAGPDRDPEADFDRLNAELARYAPALADKPQIVALNKIDLPEARQAAPDWERRFAERGVDLHVISAATGEGIGALLEAVWSAVAAPAA